ncbi:WD repeat-containing protein 48 [Acipenser ruthenus]|uniref:WD repeat-containing protein 48 n=1 Tax=Acipenser ruthenus TaxID=7906 RepID=A0A662YR29_ACIRT|nr:WD repeat-containing protein 48 [Acipenser ruthenus]
MAVIFVSYVIRDEVEKYNRNGVNALQLDPTLNRLFTAGRDSIIRIWSVNQHKVLRVWDPRTCAKLMKLKGHTDNVKSLLLNRDGTQCLSGSSDGTIRLWSLGQQRCIATYRVHDEGVWALQVNEAFTHVYSGGRDRKIYCTDLRNPDIRVLICEEKASVLKMELDRSADPPPAIWVSTTKSSVNKWSLKGIHNFRASGEYDNDCSAPLTPLCTQPEQVIKGELSELIRGELSELIRGELSELIKGELSELIRGELSELIRGELSELIKGELSELIRGELSELIRGELSELIKGELSELIRGELSELIRGELSELIKGELSELIRGELSELIRGELSELIKGELSELIRGELSELIRGGASIIQCHILNDKRHILTKDTNNNVAYWDVLKACKGEDLGKIEFDEEIKKRFKMVYVPNWFSVDLKTGMLTITLDESDCFAAWVSAKDAGFSSPDGSDPKLNLGGLLLQALLEYWPRTHINQADEEENEINHVNGEQEPRIQKGNGYFQVPPHTPVIFGEAGGRTLFRLLCRDSGGETESMLLNETVPQWVIDITVDKNMPKFNKIPFYLQPHSSSGAKTLKKDRLSASDMLQVRKVMEHVYEKIINLDNESQITSASNNEKPGEQEKEEDIAVLAEEKIELLCQDQVCRHAPPLLAPPLLLAEEEIDLLCQDQVCRHVPPLLNPPLLLAEEEIELLCQDQEHVFVAAGFGSEHGLENSEAFHLEEWRRPDPPLPTEIYVNKGGPGVPTPARPYQPPPACTVN